MDRYALIQIAGPCRWCGSGGQEVNLHDHPTSDQLRALLAAQDDEAAHHIVWVDHDGVVHITALEPGLTPAVWATDMKDRIRFRLETLDRGNGYVGLEASRDSAWVERLFRALVGAWHDGVTGYLDNF